VFDVNILRFSSDQPRGSAGRIVVLADVDTRRLLLLERRVYCRSMSEGRYGDHMYRVTYFLEK
jgi:hypothetical protein